MNKVANYYYELGRRDAFNKIAGMSDNLGSGLAAALQNMQAAQAAQAAQEAVDAGGDVAPGLMDKLRGYLPTFDPSTLGEDFGQLKTKALNALRDNPGKATAGALGLVGAGYGAKKLYDYLSHEEEPMFAPVSAPTKQEQMLALAKQYGPQAAAALAATGALYGGYRAMKSRSRDRD